MMYDEMTKQQKLATMFRHMFDKQFTEATESGAPHFDLLKSQFDNWLVMTGETPEFSKVPSCGSGVEWTAWVQLRNSLRGMLNNAASVAAHGEPPYVINKHPVDHAFWRVQLLTGMVAVTFKDASKSMLSLAKSKHKDIAKMFDTLGPHTDQLPLEQRIMLSSQKKMFTKAAIRVARDMNELLADIEETLVDTQKMIASSSTGNPQLTDQSQD